jgi:hypothetical protein
MVTKVVDEEEALREKALSTQQSAISQKPELFTAKDADKRSGDLVIGASGDRKSNTEARLTADEGGLGAFTAKDAEGAKEQKLEKGLPRINTDYTDRRSGDLVIGASGDRKSNTEALTADEGGLETEKGLPGTEESLPLIRTDRRIELFTAKDAESAKEEKLEKGLPRINTDYTDRSDSPRIDPDERGLEEEEEEGAKVVAMRM